jgi:hypothetical protein
MSPAQVYRRTAATGKLTLYHSALLLDGILGCQHGKWVVTNPLISDCDAPPAYARS